jgi:hypothetical protein
MAGRWAPCRRGLRTTRCCPPAAAVRRRQQAARRVQMVMPALRSDSALITFRRKLEKFDFDLRAWRVDQARPPAASPCRPPHTCQMLDAMPPQVLGRLQSLRSAPALEASVGLLRDSYEI